MVNMSAYFQAVLTLLPFFSSLACVTLVLASWRDSQSVAERRLKNISALYLALPLIVWICTFLYGYYPPSFVWLNVPYLLAFISLPVFFYRLVRYLVSMGEGEKERFCYLHYLAPCLLGGVLLVWSFFIPVEIQLEIITGKGEVFPAGYREYALFFLSKPLLRTIFAAIYNALTIFIMYRYYKRLRLSGNKEIKPAAWIIFLVAISLILLFNALVSYLVPRSRLYTSFWVAISALFIISQQILLTWHIIRRKYLLYVDIPKPVEVKQPSEEPAKEDTEQEEKEIRYHYGKINRKILEGYFRREKPYLNSDFKITDLVDALDVNRTMISGFINDTYGVNFNRYLNRWRLAEVLRLIALPSNQGKSVQRLVTKAGFTNSKHYLRALRAEENESNNDTKDTKNAQ